MPMKINTNNKSLNPTQSWMILHNLIFYYQILKSKSQISLFKDQHCYILVWKLSIWIWLVPQCRMYLHRCSIALWLQLQINKGMFWVLLFSLDPDSDEVWVELTWSVLPFLSLSRCPLNFLWGINDAQKPAKSHHLPHLSCLSHQATDRKGATYSHLPPFGQAAKYDKNSTANFSNKRCM